MIIYFLFFLISCTNTVSSLVFRYFSTIVILTINKDKNTIIGIKKKHTIVSNNQYKNFKDFIIELVSCLIYNNYREEAKEMILFQGLKTLLWFICIPPF